MINLPKKYSLLIKAYLSLFGIGFIPFSPGTLASAAITLIWLYALPSLSKAPLLLIPLMIFVSLVYFISVKLISAFLKPPLDKSWIVVDELVGMIISLTPTVFISSPTLIISAFICFRFFDIVKPSLIKEIDSRHTPSSIILDDLVAGVFSAGSVILISLFIL